MRSTSISKLRAASRQRKLRGHTETVAERFERDRAALLPLPIAPYEACEKVAARVSSLALVRYKGNDYSVPTRHASASAGARLRL